MANSTTLNDDELQFLLAWEEVYKKGILTYEILSALLYTPLDSKGLYEVLKIHNTTVNEHSLYRSLRRLHAVGTLDIIEKTGRNKYFKTSEKGKNILDAFIDRNGLQLTRKKRSSNE